jgi:hypothetical protein
VEDFRIELTDRTLDERPAGDVPDGSLRNPDVERVADRR